MVRDPSRRRLALADRLIEVIDDRQTGETLLDEALKMMKSSEKYGTGAWVDLMSGKSSQASAWMTTTLPSAIPRTTLTRRGNMERDEDRLSTKTSSRTTRKRPRRQGNSTY